jgi:hypothetical protein
LSLDFFHPVQHSSPWRSEVLAGEQDMDNRVGADKRREEVGPLIPKMLWVVLAFRIPGVVTSNF